MEFAFLIILLFGSLFMTIWTATAIVFTSLGTWEQLLLPTAFFIIALWCLMEMFNSERERRTKKRNAPRIAKEIKREEFTYRATVPQRQRRLISRESRRKVEEHERMTR